MCENPNQSETPKRAKARGVTVNVFMLNDYPVALTVDT